MKFLLFVSLIFVASCDVKKQTVGDNPPELAHVKALSGRKFGHIVLTTATKRNMGNGFSVFEWPPTRDFGARFGEQQHHKLVMYVRHVGQVADGITQTQFQARAIFNRFKEKCGFERKIHEETTETPEVDCNTAMERKVLKADYEYCGLRPDDDKKMADLDHCACLRRNGKKIYTAMKTLDVEEQTKSILILKLGLGQCAWSAVDPVEQTERSRFWLMGDDRSRDGEPDEVSELGSRLSLIDAGNGEVQVKLDLMNLNGVNYTTEEYGLGLQWAKIHDVEYDMGKHRLSFTIIEEETYGKPTGRVLEFSLDRNTVFASMPNFNRFQGDMIIKKDGKEVGKGSAKIDGFLQEKEPYMPKIWDFEVKENGLVLPVKPKE